MNQKFEIKSAEMRLNNPTEESSQDGNQQLYKTYDRAANVRKLLLELPDGTIEILDYAYLMRTKYSAQDGSITLHYTWGDIVLIGIHLKVLVRDFCINRPMEILCIHDRYNLIPSNNKFIVNKILRQQ